MNGGEKEHQVVIRPATPNDREAWLRLRRELWTDGTEAEHWAEIQQFFIGDTYRETWIALLAEDKRGEIVGYAEYSIRPFAEGCVTDRVLYLEGWYVDSQARRLGVGRALVAAGADWGRTLGCSEFASDTAPANLSSTAAHLALGFDDLGLVRCFRKEL